MKKYLKIFMSFLMVLSLCGCSKKEPISTTEFINIMESNTATVTDVTEDLKSEGITISSGTRATNTEDKWQIELYILNDDKTAKQLFEHNKSLFEYKKGNNATQTSVELGNYSSYELSDDTSYMYLSRIDNTLLYIDVDIEHKDTIKTYIEELGY